MESGKIVKLLILIFALLTLLFYCLFRNEEKHVSVLSDRFISEAVQNLSFRGVSVEENTIINAIPDDSIYVYEYKNETQYSDTVTAAFESTLDSQTASSKMNTPEGFSVTFSNEDNHDEKTGRLLFADSDLGFVYTAYGSNISSNSSVIYNSDVEVDEYQLSIVSRLVQNLSAHKSMGYRITGSVDGEDYVMVSAVQTVNGVDLHDVYINFVFEENKLVHAMGRWITVKHSAEYSEDLKDGVNVLYNLDFDKVSEIKSERIVYTMKKGSAGKYYLVPCWEIVTADEEGGIKREYFDAL